MDHLRYKTFIQRLGALLIDGIVFAIVFFLLDFIVDVDIPDWVFISRFLLIAYRIVAHWKFGRTIGKWAVQVRVVQAGNEETLPTFHQAFLREIASIILVAIELIPGMPVLILYITSGGWLAAALVCVWKSDQQRSAHDLIASTVVVDTKTYSDWEKKYYYGQKS